MKRTVAISGFVTVLTVLAFSGASSPASAQMVQEGKYGGTYSAFGTFKATPIGKERLLTVFDDNGFNIGQWPFDHMTQHCWGTGDFTNGMGQNRGYCVAIDVAGDQIVGNFEDEKHAPDQKNWHGTFTITTGTGKLAGISGGSTYLIHNEFRTASEGTYVAYVTFEGSYKLPTPTN
jgi:hypothetical protein